MVPETPTTAILSHKPDFRPREPKPEIDSTDADDDDEDAWASATTSSTANFPVTSLAEVGNPVTSFSNENSSNTRLAENVGGTAVGASPMTSFTENGDPVTSLPLVHKSTNTMERSGPTEITQHAVCQLPVTSVVGNRDSVTSYEIRKSLETMDGFRLTKYETDGKYHLTSLAEVGIRRYFLDATPTASGGSSPGESLPTTSSVTDSNPAASYSSLVSDESQVDGENHYNRSTGSSYPTTGSSIPITGSDVGKLFLATLHDNRPMVFPTTGDVLAEVGVAEEGVAEMGVAEEVSIESATTTDHTLALVCDSLSDLSSSRDVIDKYGDPNDQTGGVWTSTNCQEAKDEPGNNTKSGNEDIPKRGNV